MSFIATAVGGGIALAAGGGAGVIAAGALAGSAIGSSINSRNAANKAASMVNNLQYQPIDLNQLQAQAQGFAEQNLAKSIELEKQYLPSVAAARTGLQQQISQDLMRGGNLPTDVANQVTKASMAQAGAGGFGAGPLTAAQLGLSAYDLRTQAQQRANAFLQANPLPTSGLDPGSLASVAVGQNQTQNAFNVGKTGAQINALQGVTKADNALAGSLASGFGSFAGMMGGASNLGTSGFGNFSPASASSIAAGNTFGNGLSGNWNTGGFSSTLLPITTKTTGF